MVRKDVEVALDDVRDLRRLIELAWEDGSIQNRTIASLYIRAMIRGNDALCLHFLSDKPSRHHQAQRYFRRLYEEGHIDEEYSKYSDNVGEVIRQKSEMEYKAENISKNDLQKLSKQVDRFLEKVVFELLEE